MKIIHTKKGFSLVEIVIGAAIITVAGVAILNSYAFIIQSEIRINKSIEGTYLAEEGIESMKYLRDKGWTANILNLSTSSTYYLSVSTSSGVATFSVTTTPQISNSIFTRKINLSSINRSATTYDIVSSGGTYDADTRKINVTVTWPAFNNATMTRALSSYITNLNRN